MSISSSAHWVRTTIMALALAGLLAPLGAAQAAPQVLKIATVSPEGSHWMTQMRAGAREIAERTEGRVQLKFYGGGVMGNDKKVLRKMRIGQLHGATFTSAGLAEREPNLQIYGLPLMFESEAEVDHVRAQVDQLLVDRLGEAGLVSFGLAGGGFAKLMSNAPLRSLDDLRGKKIWIPEGDTTSYAAMEVLGLAPVTLPITDVLTGLQTGLIDIIGSSAVAAVVLQWHTKVRYVSDLPILYIYATLVLDRRAFERLEARDRQHVRAVMTEIYSEFDRTNRKDEVEASAALTEAGIETIAIEDPELPTWRARVNEVNRGLAVDGIIDAALLARVEQLLAQFRDRRSADAMP